MGNTTGILTITVSYSRVCFCLEVGIKKMSTNPLSPRGRTADVSSEVHTPYKGLQLQQGLLTGKSTSDPKSSIKEFHTIQVSWLLTRGPEAPGSSPSHRTPLT